MKKFNSISIFIMKLVIAVQSFDYLHAIFFSDFENIAKQGIQLMILIGLLIIYYLNEVIINLKGKDGPPNEKD